MAGKAGGSGSGGFASGENGGAPEAAMTKTLSYGQGKFMTESAGLLDGVSVREGMNSDDSEPQYDYAKDPVTGNATERRANGKTDVSAVSAKGKSFDLGTF